MRSPEQSSVNRGGSTTYDDGLTPMPQVDRATGRDLSGLQKVAEATHGVVTPANAVTMAGLALTAKGCHEFVHGDKRKAVGIIAAGVICDALDGAMARATRTANYPVGRHLDIVTDGAKAVMLGKALHDSGAYSGRDLLMNYGPKALGWVANGIKIARGGIDHAKTSQVARVAEISRWFGPGLAAVSAVLNNSSPNRGGGSPRRAGGVEVETGNPSGSRSARTTSLYQREARLSDDSNLSLPLTGRATGRNATRGEVKNKVAETLRKSSKVATLGACALGLIAAAGYFREVDK